jgi:hypothetical protein
MLIKISINPKDPYTNEQEPELENSNPRVQRNVPSRPPKQQPQASGIDLDMDLEEGSVNGSVTVMSARTPIRPGADQLTVLPPPNRAGYQAQPTKYSFQNQPAQNPNKPSQVSLSQRIETTSTPLQLAPPSASLRGVSGGPGLINKDGATDV